MAPLTVAIFCVAGALFGLDGIAVAAVGGIVVWSVGALAALIVWFWKFDRARARLGLRGGRAMAPAALLVFLGAVVLGFMSGFAALAIAGRIVPGLSSFSGP